MTLGSKGHAHTVPQTPHSPQALSSSFKAPSHLYQHTKSFSIFLLCLKFLLKYNNLENLQVNLSVKHSINFHKLNTLLEQYLDKEQDIPTFRKGKKKTM